MLNNFDIAGMLHVSYKTGKWIADLVNSGLDVMSVVSIVMAVLGGGGVVTAALIAGIKEKIYKKGIVAAGLW